jgi:hypothetical protein
MMSLEALSMGIGSHVVNHEVPERVKAGSNNEDEAQPMGVNKRPPSLLELVRPASFQLLCSGCQLA